MGIQILPPDINRSEGVFSVEGGSIRYALSAIKGIGKPVMEAIAAERTENGPFDSLRMIMTDKSRQLRQLLYLSQ